MKHNPCTWIVALTIFTHFACGDLDSKDGARLYATPYDGASASSAYRIDEADQTDAAPRVTLPEGCTTGVQVVYSPMDSLTVNQFPDDVYTVLDAESPTGRRLSITDNFAWATEVPDAAPSLVDDLNELSGFALSGEIFFEFDAAISEPETSDTPNMDAVALFELD